MADTVVASLLGAPSFGRNGVQYDAVDFRVLHTRPLDVPFYTAGTIAFATDRGRGRGTR